MSKQTYIVLHWYGADTYTEALKKYDYNNRDKAGYDFNRVSCKKVETALKYLANWKKEALERELFYLYPTLLREDAHYEIRATPDGYNETETVARGMMKDL